MKNKKGFWDFMYEHAFTILVFGVPTVGYVIVQIIEACK